MYSLHFLYLKDDKYMFEDYPPSSLNGITVLFITFIIIIMLIIVDNEVHFEFELLITIEFMPVDAVLF